MIFAYDKSYHKHFAWLSVSVGVGCFDPHHIKWQKLSFDSACAAVKISGSF